MLKQIKKQVADVVSHSQCFDDPNVDGLIDTWLEAKRDFIEVFGGKLIYEVPIPITFKMTEAAKQARIDELCQYVVNQYDYYKLAEFINNNKDGFFDNQVIMNSIYNGKKIPTGAKLIKSFKHFVHGDSALHDIQSRASQIIQEDVVSGTLCFSVHPLDYLSSSENTYNWRSCHALDGEYRAGNLSYMCDKATVICYLRGAENVKLPMFPDSVPWNNKKWRMLLHVSDNWDLIFAGRQYPFESEIGLDTVKAWFLNIIRNDNSSWCEWTDPIIKNVADSHEHEYDLRNEYIMLRGELLNLREVVIDPESPLHFNDILHSSFYKPHYTGINNRPWVKERYSPVHVGTRCKCLKCGEEYIKSTETFMCNDCDLEYGVFDSETFTTCDCCGRRIYREDAWFIGDEEICEDCVNTECFYCERCEEYHFTTDRVYLEEEDIYVCRRCADEG